MPIFISCFSFVWFFIKHFGYWIKVKRPLNWMRRAIHLCLGDDFFFQSRRRYSSSVIRSLLVNVCDVIHEAYSFSIDIVRVLWCITQCAKKKRWNACYSFITHNIQYFICRWKHWESFYHLVPARKENLFHFCGSQPLRMQNSHLNVFVYNLRV